MVQPGGGLAEYAIAPISTTIKRRHDVTPVLGTSLGVCGFAALQSVRNSGGIDIEGRSKETKNLLIRAASGGVGTLAVQVLSSRPSITSSNSANAMYTVCMYCSFVIL